MPPLEPILLAAIPAPARQILVIGEALLHQRALWEQRNPLAEIATVPPDHGCKAAIVGIDALGGDPAATIGPIAGAVPDMATLALCASGPESAAIAEGLNPAGGRRPGVRAAAAIRETHCPAIHPGRGAATAPRICFNCDRHPFRFA